MIPTKNLKHDTAGMIVAAVLILIGVAAWWDTTTMGDPDSYVFPRAVITTMVAFCLMLIVFNLIRPVAKEENGGDTGSSPRRIFLVAVMLVGAGVMPLLGFIISGLMVFAALTWTAMYDSWTRSRLTVYPISGVAIVVGFYLLFSELLLVPLPTGMFFD